MRCRRMRMTGKGGLWCGESSLGHHPTANRGAVSAPRLIAASIIRRNIIDHNDANNTFGFSKQRQKR